MVGHPALWHMLERAPYAALATRIQARVALSRGLGNGALRADDGRTLLCLMLRGTA